MTRKKILIFTLLALSTTCASGSKVNPSPHNDNQHDNSPNNKKCLCSKNSGPNLDVASTFPPGHEIERLVVIVYRDVDDNRITKYIPSLETQKTIPDLEFYYTDELTPVSDETIQDTFIKSPHKTIERKNSILPDENVRPNIDIEEAVPNAVIYTDVVHASQNDHKLNVPNSSLNNMYDQHTYDVPAISQYTSAHHITHRYDNLLYVNRESDMPTDVNMRNLNPNFFPHLVIQDGKVIAIVKELPYIETVSFISPYSHNRQAVPIDIELLQEAMVKTNLKNTPGVKTTSTSKSDYKFYEEDTNEKHKQIKLRLLIEPSAYESSLLSSNLHNKLTDIELLPGDEQQNNDTDVEHTLILKSKDDPLSPEDSDKRNVIDKQNDGLSLSRKHSQDASSISTTVLANVDETANRRVLRPNKDSLKIPKTIHEVDLSNEPVIKEDVLISRGQNRPFINRRLGRMHTSDSLPDADTLYYRDLSPDEDILNDVYSKTDPKVDRMWIPNFLTDVSREREIPVDYDGISPSTMTPKTRRLYISRGKETFNTPSKHIRIENYPDLSLKSRISLEEIPVSETVHMQEIRLPNIESVPGLDILDNHKVHNRRVSPGISAIAYKLINSIMPKMPRTGAKIKVEEIINDEGYETPDLELPEQQDFVSRSATDPEVPGVLDKEEVYDFLVENDEDDDDGSFRIIGGNAATGSGTPLSNRGRSGRLH